MADNSLAVRALKEARPPATDRFTYLALVEQHISPELLPTLNEILQDAPVTQEIGWDLVEMLIPIPGCETCLETIARLGNPREVILKVLEVLETMKWSGGESDEDADADEAEASAAQAAYTARFITLLGMLAILHKRIRTRYPSRFLGTTLRTVLSTYHPNQEMTASVVNLVHSLSGFRRPTLPSRRSTINVANPDQDGDTSKNAPDPEAEQEDPAEADLQERMLLSFVTCVLEAYANANAMDWAPRLLEHLYPDRLVPGKKTALERYREEQELSERDNIVGQLAALTRDLGLSECSQSFTESLYKKPIRRDPLADVDSISGPGDLPLSTGGSICLAAYWIFSSAVFGAGQPKPDMYIFPDNYAVLAEYMADDGPSQVSITPGTTEAIVAIGLWLQHEGRIAGPSAAGNANFMKYVHLMTLCAVFHPSLEVRNAATLLAGMILHADRDAEDRLRILEDLLENCEFPSLKAVAVNWLQEEIGWAVGATLGKGTIGKNTSGGGGGEVFSTPYAIERLQYLIFPDLQFVKDMDDDEFVDYMQHNSPFVHKASSFAYLLFRSSSFKDLLPPGMVAAVEQRWVEPLLQCAKKLVSSDAAKGKGGERAQAAANDAEVLIDCFSRLAL